jgi:hypothetical protein
MVRASVNNPVSTTSTLFDHLLGAVVRETMSSNASIREVVGLGLP